jgi:ketosteroid isomerase-like protein
MGEQSVDVVRGIYEAFGRGDLPAVLGAMADDIEWHEAEGMPYGGVYHGGEAVAQNVFGPTPRTSPTLRLSRRNSSPQGMRWRRSSATQVPEKQPASS